MTIDLSIKLIHPQLAAAARAFAPFLAQLAAEVKTSCNEFDGDLLHTAATVCSETEEDADGWPLVHIQSATRALRRASQEAGWSSIVYEPLTEAADDAWWNAYTHLCAVLNDTWRAFCDHGDVGYPNTVEGAAQCQRDEDRLRAVHRAAQACLDSLLICVGEVYDWRAAMEREAAE